MLIVALPPPSPRAQCVLAHCADCASDRQEEEPVPYSFFVGDLEVTSSLQDTLERLTVDSEKVLNIVYQPQAVFRVKAVTRCTRYDVSGRWP